MSVTEEKSTDVLSLGVIYDGEFQRFKPMTGAGPEEDTALGILLFRARRLLRGRSDFEVEVMATSTEAVLAEFLPQLIVGEVEPHQSAAEVKDSLCGPGYRADIAMYIAEPLGDVGPVTIHSSAGPISVTKSQLLAACALVMIVRALESNQRGAFVESMEAVELVVHAEYAAGIQPEEIARRLISERNRKAGSKTQERNGPAKVYAINLHKQRGISKRDTAREAKPEVLRLAPWLSDDRAEITIEGWIREHERANK